MESKDVILIGLSVIGLIWGYVQTLKANKMQSERDNNKALWHRVDELKKDVTTVRDLIQSEYMTARQVQEYFRLSTEAWVVKLDHIDSQIQELKSLFERKFP